MEDEKRKQEIGKKIKGKTVDRVNVSDRVVTIYFTDGTSVEMENDLYMEVLAFDYYDKNGVWCE